MTTRIAFIIVTLLMFWSCNNKVVGTWANPKGLLNDYDTIMIAALTINLQAKFILEQQIADQLSRKGVTASKSSNIFAPNFTDHHNNKEKVLNKIRNRNTNAILTVSIIDSNSFTEGWPNSTPDSCRENFWDYYTSLYSEVYKPRYYLPEKTYYIETNLYDSDTEELVWSSRSSEYSPWKISSFAREFAEYLTLSLEKDQIIKSGNGNQSERRLHVRKNQPPVELSSSR